MSEATDQLEHIRTLALGVPGMKPKPFDVKANMESPVGLRFNEGKPQWHLVDWSALEPMVRVLEYGAEKYTPNNWKKGMSQAELMDCLLRHCFAWTRGEDNDPESKLSHMGHILSNAMMLSYMCRWRPDYDDRELTGEDKKCGVDVTPKPSEKS